MPSFPLDRLALIVGSGCALAGCDGYSSQAPKLMNLVAIVAGTASAPGGSVAAGTMIRVTPINVGTASRGSLEWTTGDSSAAADTIYVDVRVGGS
jgi:hypothetical protein